MGLESAQLLREFSTSPGAEAGAINCRWSIRPEYPSLKFSITYFVFGTPDGG
jgi:hypothetical protein